MESEHQTLRAALRKHVEILTVDIGPRTPFHGDSLDRASGYIQSVLRQAGFAVEEQAYEFRGRRVANLVASINARAADTYLVGAHYDTVQTTPGADDNASAVAVMLELARRVSKSDLRLPLSFVAFTLEEPPAHMTRDQGSRVFVRQCRERGDTVLGAMILEMVGYTTERQRYPILPKWPGYPAEGDFIGIIGNWRSRPFGHKVLKGFRGNKRLPAASLFVPFNGWVLPSTRLSDHAPFWDAGWPALMITDTAFFRNPNYHLPSDTIETLDFGFMAELVVSLERALHALADGSHW